MSHPAYIAIKSAVQGENRVTRQLFTALLATGAGLGVFLGIRGLIRGVKRNARERHALIDGNPAAFATQLKLAFENDNYFGWGTNEETVFSTLEAIPTKAFFKRVQRAYRDLFGRNLSAVLSSELDFAEYAKATDIINAKS